MERDRCAYISLRHPIPSPPRADHSLRIHGREFDHDARSRPAAARGSLVGGFYSAQARRTKKGTLTNDSTKPRPADRRSREWRCVPKMQSKQLPFISRTKHDLIVSRSYAPSLLAMMASRGRPARVTTLEAAGPSTSRATIARASPASSRRMGTCLIHRSPISTSFTSVVRNQFIFCDKSRHGLLTAGACSRRTPDRGLPVPAYHGTGRSFRCMCLNSAVGSSLSMEEMKMLS